MCWSRYQRCTFGDLCDVGVGDADVRDALQVGKRSGIDPRTLQRVGPEL